MNNENLKKMSSEGNTLEAEAQNTKQEIEVLSENVNNRSVVLVTSITITPSSRTMLVGQSAIFGVNVFPSNATDKCVRWQSSRPSVASINPNSGLICTLSAGTTTISAIACDGSGVIGHSTLTVNDPIPVERIEVSPTSLTLGIGETSTLCATIYPSNATDKRIRWTTDNCNIAEVSAGSVTAKSTMGSTNINAEAYADSDIRGKCTVTVNKSAVGGTPIIVKCAGGLSVMTAASGGTVCGTFLNETTVFLIDETPQNETMFYVYGTTSNGTSVYGWCCGEYLEKKVTFLKSTSSDNINVRSAPSTSSTKIGKMLMGDHFPLLKEKGGNGSGYDWHQILFNNMEGYVYVDPKDDNYDIVDKWVLLAYGCNHISEKGLAMLKILEGYSSTAYKPDPSETLWTIGYGHVITDGGSSVTINNVTYSELTKDLADTLLRNDIAEIFEVRFNNFLQCNNVRLNQYQYDACIIDTYQKGQNIWHKEYNESREIVKFILANQDFDNYNKVLNAFIDGATKSGWVNRRTKEANLFVHNRYS